MGPPPHLDAQPSSSTPAFNASSYGSPSPAPSFPSYDLASDLRSRSPTPLDDPIGVPASQQPMERERHSAGGGWGSIGSGSAVARRRTPPNRSTTMDDRLPQGPTQGVLTQQWGSPEPLYENTRGQFFCSGCSGRVGSSKRICYRLLGRHWCCRRGQDAAGDDMARAREDSGAGRW